jgi:hypothetical protein
LAVEAVTVGDVAGRCCGGRLPADAGFERVTTCHSPDMVLYQRYEQINRTRRMATKGERSEREYVYCVCDERSKEQANEREEEDIGVVARITAEAKGKVEKVTGTPVSPPAAHNLLSFALRLKSYKCNTRLVASTSHLQQL